LTSDAVVVLYQRISTHVLPQVRLIYQPARGLVRQDEWLVEVKDQGWAKRDSLPLVLLEIAQQYNVPYRDLLTKPVEVCAPVVPAATRRLELE
jgi:hypothetical protein